MQITVNTEANEAVISLADLAELLSRSQSDPGSLVLGPPQPVFTDPPEKVHTYMIRSYTDPNTQYRVLLATDANGRIVRQSCACPDQMYRSIPDPGHYCKHISEARYRHWQRGRVPS